MIDGRSRLRELMHERRPLLAVGAYDALSAVLVERAGCDLVYLSGLMASASYLGQPDLGLMTASERALLAANITPRVSIPVIADADQGYGSELNVMNTVERFEAAGLAGIHLDDEVFPGKCQSLDAMGPTPLVSVEEMCRKVRAALRARRSSDFVIMVRSDVFGSVEPGSVPREELVGRAIDRANAYVDAGAELVFVYAKSKDELERYANEVNTSLVGLLGFIAPFSLADFAELGYSIVVCPLPVICTAAKALDDMLGTLVSTGDWQAIEDRLMSFDDLTELLSLERYTRLPAALSAGDG